MCSRNKIKNFSKRNGHLNPKILCFLTLTIMVLMLIGFVWSSLAPGLSNNIKNYDVDNREYDVDMGVEYPNPDEIKRLKKAWQNLLQEMGKSEDEIKEDLPVEVDVFN